MSLPLFVTGARCFGGARHGTLGDALFLGRAHVRAIAYDLGDDSGLVLRGGGDTTVGGELYRADDALLGRIDHALGERFVRKVVQVRAGGDGPSIDAWVHVYVGPWQGVATLPGGQLAGATPTAWYFGYASNMFHFAERRKLTVFGAHRLGRIDGWRIAFAKDSGDGVNCYATLLPKRGGEVKGALYRMTQVEIESNLDPQEKEGWHLVRRTFPLVLEDGGPGHGETIWADAYLCLPRWWVWGRASHPVNTEKIVPGARLVGLDAAYVAWLAEFVDKPCVPEDYDLDLDVRV